MSPRTPNDEICQATTGVSPTPASRELVSPAAKAAQLGYSVLPVRGSGEKAKAATLQDWPNKSTRDAAKAAKIPGAYGINCIGMPVIDLDVNDGRTPLEVLDALAADIAKRTGEKLGAVKAELAPHIKATTLITTPSGGSHIFGAVPDGVRIVSVGAAIPGVDIRAGYYGDDSKPKGAGYVVGFGSNFGEGKSYKGRMVPRDKLPTFGPITLKWLQLVAGADRQKHSGSSKLGVVKPKPSKQPNTFGKSKVDVAALRSALGTLGEMASGSNDDWYRPRQCLVNAVRAGEITEDEALELYDEFSKLCGDKYAGRDAVEEAWHATLKGPENKGDAALSLGSIFGWAKQAGWVGSARAAAQRDSDTSTGAETDDVSTDKLTKDATLPKGYFRGPHKAIFYEAKKTSDAEADDTKPIYVCSNTEILAAGKDSDNTGHGLKLRIHSKHGGSCDWYMSDALLAGEGTELGRELLSRGATPAQGQKGFNLLKRLLSHAKPPKVLPVANQPGWLGDTFVMPDTAYGPNGATDVAYTGPHDKALVSSGSLDDWKKRVCIPCEAHSRLTLAVSVAFAGAVMHPIGAQPFMIHFRGPSSVGKSITQAAASSVYGAPSHYAMSWSMTANGSEAAFASRSGMLVNLDEIGLASPTDIGNVVYGYSEGTGKKRMTKALEARENKRWSNTALSSGEVSLADVAKDKRGEKQTIKAGQDMRCIDVYADAEKGFGILDSAPEQGTSAQFLDRLKADCNEVHGTAGREFVSKFAADYVSNKGKVLKYKAAFVNAVRSAIELKIGTTLESQVVRVLEHFGIIAAAGKLATEFGVTGWATGSAEKAAEHCFRGWLAKRGTVSNAEPINAVRALKQFAASHAARINDLSALRNAPPPNCIGFTPAKGQELCIFAHCLSEVCGGIGEKDAAKALKAAGMLVTATKGLKQRRSYNGANQNVYALDTSKF